MTEEKIYRKEHVVLAFLKCFIFIALAFFVFMHCVAFEKHSYIRNDTHTLNPTPVPAPKPVMTPREFPTIEIVQPEVIATILEESEAVGDEYFADAVFAGDSLTDGFRIYDVGQHFDVISFVGLSPATAITQPVYKAADGTMLTMAEAIRYLGSRKAYILLGTNGLEWSTPESLIQGYAKLVDQLMSVNPDTYIILQSIPPVTQKTASDRPKFTKERVEYYNSLIKELAIEKGIYFLDVYSAFVTEEGYLSTSIAAHDGIHMFPSGYKIWFEYITTHTIKGNSSFTMDSQGRIIPMKPVESLEETDEDLEDVENQ